MPNRFEGGPSEEDRDFKAPESSPKKKRGDKEEIDESRRSFLKKLGWGAAGVGAAAVAGGVLKKGIEIDRERRQPRTENAEVATPEQILQNPDNFVGKGDVRVTGRLELVSSKEKGGISPMPTTMFEHGLNQALAKESYVYKFSGSEGTLLVAASSKLQENVDYELLGQIQKSGSSYVLRANMIGRKGETSEQR